MLRHQGATQRQTGQGSLLACQGILYALGRLEYLFLRLLRSCLEFLGWPDDDSLQFNMGVLGLEIYKATETHSINHKGINMKITKSLTERLFVMFLESELELQQRIGNARNMKHCVSVAESNTIHAVENMNIGFETKSLAEFVAGGGK